MATWGCLFKAEVEDDPQMGWRSNGNVEPGVGWHGAVCRDGSRPVGRWARRVDDRVDERINSLRQRR